MSGDSVKPLFNATELAHTSRQINLYVDLRRMAADLDRQAVSWDDLRRFCLSLEDYGVVVPPGLSEALHSSLLGMADTLLGEIPSSVKVRLDEKEIPDRENPEHGD